MNVDPAHPVSLAFVNGSLATNKWGQLRSYGFQLGATVTQMLDDSVPWMPSQQWTKYNIAVTQRKDSEAKSGYPLYDMQAPADAVVNFDSYINGESLDNEDLVAWIMIGNVHIPSSEDIPVTTTAHTELSFFIKPFNYFDESPAIDLSKRIIKTGTLYPDTPSVNIDKVNTPLASRCFDGTPVNNFV
jgi:diamine oxidase